MSKEIPCPKCGHVWLWADWKKDKDAFCPEGRGCAREDKARMDKSPIEQIKELAPMARIEMLENEVKNLRKGLEIYERERNRYKHAKPEITGAYFLAGGLGEIDDNYLPQFVEIVPAYGCGWSQVYEKTDRTISYEGS